MNISGADTGQPPEPTPWEAVADLVVVGSGVAGLTAALDSAAAGLRVVVVTKDAILVVPKESFNGDPLILRWPPGSWISGSR